MIKQEGRGISLGGDLYIGSGRTRRRNGLAGFFEGFEVKLYTFLHGFFNRLSRSRNREACLG